jgi:hypothetical protein
MLEAGLAEKRRSSTPTDFAVALNTLSKSAYLGPAQVRWVRDLGRLFRVMYAERRRT